MIGPQSSSVVPMRCSGDWRSSDFKAAGWVVRNVSVEMIGRKTLEVIPYYPHSRAAVRVIARMASFAMP